MIAEKQPSGSRLSTGLSDRGALLSVIALVIGSTLLALLGTERFFLRDDLQDQYLGGYAEVARAWKAGEVPLITSQSWQSAALAGEFQYGVFSPFLVVCNLLLFGVGLPLWAIAAGLVLIHLLVLAGGAYVLARSELLSPPLAMMVALATSMNGWLIIWGVNWFPALASFAWVPWAWWAMKRSLSTDPNSRSVGPVVASGVFVALIVTAGWPYTCLMIGLIGAMLAAKSMAQKQSLLAPIHVALGGLIGLGLSAPAWLMLVEYSGVTLRGQTSSPWTVQTDFLVPIKAYLAMILPSLEAAWQVPWRDTLVSDSLVMQVGLAPVVLPITAFVVLRSSWVKEVAPELAFLLMLWFLVTFPSVGIFKWSFRWLPLLFLQLALIAGHAAQALCAHEARRPGRTIRSGAVALTLILLMIGYQQLFDRATVGIPWIGVGLAIVALFWFLIERQTAVHFRQHLPWVVVLVTSLWTFALGFRSFPFDLWHRQVEARAEPVFDPDVTYLALYSQASYSSAPIRYPGQRYYPGNEHLHAGLRFVNGYSPMGPVGSTRLFGFNYVGAFSTEDPGKRPLGAILKRMAVDGLITWDHAEVKRNLAMEDFEWVGSELGANLFRRKAGRTSRVQTVRQAFLARSPESSWQQRHSPWPLLESLNDAAPDEIPRPQPPETARFGEAELTLRAEERLRVAVDVDARQSERPVLITFSRPWLPGYRVEIDGRRAELLRLDGIQPAVEVPAGSKTLVELLYRPPSLSWGLRLSSATLVSLLAAWIWISGGRRRDRLSSSTQLPSGHA